MKITSFLIILIFMASCQPEKAVDQTESAGEIISFEYAKHLKVDIANDSLMIKIYNPDNGSLEKTISLLPDSTYKIISLSSTTNGMLSVLGMSDQIVGISARKYLHDDQLIKHFEKGGVGEFGESTSQSVEKIILSDADIVFYSGFGKKFPNAEQLEKLGITIIPLYDWREEKALGKAEWIKLAGLITDHQNEANDFFRHVQEEYNNMVALGQKAEHKPTVMAGNLYGDIWYAPLGNSFGAQLIHNAGGEYVYKNSTGTGSLSLTLEQVLDKNRDTEVWLNPGLLTKAEVLQSNPHADKLKSFDNMFCYSGNMNYYWERSSIEPHLLLSDLIKIFHPDLLTDQKFNFYSKIN